MTDTNPFEAAFDLQRTALEQTHKATMEALDAQTSVADRFAQNIDSIEQAQRQSTELSREAVDSYFDAIDNINPDADVDELREFVEEQFDTFEQSHEETWDAIAESTDDGIDGFEEFAEVYAEFLEQSFDGLLEAHERVGEETSEMTEQVMETAEDLAEEAS